MTRLEKATLLGGADFWHSHAYPHAELRALTFSDGPHGIRLQTGSGDHLGIQASAPATCFPTASALASTWNPSLAEEFGRALGSEAAALGVDVVLGPGLNLKRNPRGGRSFEYLSEDPYLSGKLAAAVVRGIQSQGIAAAPKHFAVNNQENHRMVVDVVVDERTLRELYLTSFEIVIRESQPAALMTAYNRVGGHYAHEHPHLLNRILRREWAYEGVVVSDWGGSRDAVASVRAGATLEMPAPGLESARDLLRAVDSGGLSRRTLDARAREMSELVRQVDPTRATPLDVDANRRTARRVAAEGAVLLKNEGALPLAQGARVALIGPFAERARIQGFGSSRVNPRRVADAVTEMRARGFDVDVASGVGPGGERDPDLLDDASKAARDADVAVVHLGLPDTSETEGRDRLSLELPPAQLELLTRVRAVARRVVVVITAGSVIDVRWEAEADAILLAHLGGEAGAEAVADILVGHVSPSGRLTETFPMTADDIPDNARFGAEVDAAEYREGLYVGYRLTTTLRRAVRYPFGFGLTYSEFSYSDIAVDATGVTFTIENVGPRAAADVAQLYVGRLGDDIPGPVRELKGFTKRTLEPGERVVARVPFDDYTFRRYDTEQDGWVDDGGDWWIGVGVNAHDIRLEATMTRPGRRRPMGSVPAPYARGQVFDVSNGDFEALLGRPRPMARDAERLTSDDPLHALSRARSPFARAVGRLLERSVARADATGEPDLDALFRHGMPFRAIAKMTGGRVDRRGVDALVRIANGEHLRGVVDLARAFVRNSRSNRLTRRALRAAAQERTPR